MLAGGLNTPRFTLKDWSTSTCTNNYSCLQLQIKFAREFGFYLIQIYVPCSMLVIVSWLPFLLEPTAVEARVSLGVTTILTIVTLIYGINQNTQPTSYAKALDVWTSFCMGMVFAALLQFSTVNYVCNVQWVKARKQLAQLKNDSEREEIKSEEAKLLSQFLLKERIDQISRIFILPFLQYLMQF
ncbi:Glutamate-gated chloride channel, partial [Orchesella cincta]